jgi:hypothetical protein
MVLTLGDLELLKQLRGAGGLARNVSELNIRLTLDRLVKGGYLVGRPAPPFLLKAGHSFFRKGGATVLPRPQHFRSPLTLAKAAQSISAGRCRSHVTRGSNSFAVAYVYFESEPGRRAAAHLMTKDEARKVAAGIAKLPDLLGAARREDGNPLVQRMP